VIARLAAPSSAASPSPTDAARRGWLMALDPRWAPAEPNTTRRRRLRRRRGARAVEHIGRAHIAAALLVDALRAHGSCCASASIAATPTSVDPDDEQRRHLRQRASWAVFGTRESGDGGVRPRALFIATNSARLIALQDFTRWRWPVTSLAPRAASGQDL